MIIGIEKGIRSKGFFKNAREMNLECKSIDCSKNNVMQQLDDVDIFIWHWSHENYREVRSARAIIKAAEVAGKKVYPDINTCWMFDDKISQKYLLESLKVPFISTYVFYDYEKAIKWLANQKYPMVYKLPQGAGSENVKLVLDYKAAVKLCKKHFSVFGIPEIDIGWSIRGIEDSLKKFNCDKVKYGVNKKGCIYFQKYLEGNTYDIRVTTIGEKNYIFRRYVRKNDFRASGSGKIDYNVSADDLAAIKIARKITNKLKTQTMAYDFVYDNFGNLQVCEMSYGFVEKAVEMCPGWYDGELNFSKEATNVYAEILKILLKEEK